MQTQRIQQTFEFEALANLINLPTSSFGMTVLDCDIVPDFIKIPKSRGGTDILGHL